MKINAFKLILTAILAVFLVSCNNDENEELQDNKKYTLASIQWKLAEGDGLEIVEKQIPKEVFRNDGNLPMPVVIKPIEKIEETSYFECDDMEFLNKWGGEDLFVSVPSEFSLLSDSYGYFAGGVQAPLYAGEKVRLKPTIHMQDSTNLPPNTEFSYEATVNMKKITATFSARFVTEDGGYDSFEVTGKWIGILFNNISERGVYNDIK